MHVMIKGFVQGVGFRYFTAREASSLGLTGYVRNVVTGEVEVLACGHREDLEAFLAILRQGPSSSRVQKIHVTWQEATETYTQFTIR